MIDQVMQDLINFLKTTAPVIWETFVRQVYAEAIFLVFWAVVLIIFSAILFKIGKNWEKTCERDHDSSEIFMLPYTLAIVATIIYPILLGNAIKMFINPNFYAIKSILSTITGK